jgi:hypothetical protein
MTVPLTMFYRFHSSVCLVDIWKSAYERGEWRVRVSDSHRAAPLRDLSVSIRANVPANHLTLSSQIIPSSWIWRCMVLVKSDVSEELTSTSSGRKEPAR